MTTEELTKRLIEAAEIIKAAYESQTHAIDMIEAHRWLLEFENNPGSPNSTPASMTWEEAQQKVAEKYGYINWMKLMIDCSIYGYRVENYCKEANNLCMRTNLEAALQSQWISVEDGPPDCIDIIANTGGLRISLNYINKTYFTPNGDIWTSPVTHWMPIPPFKP